MNHLDIAKHLDRNIQARNGTNKLVKTIKYKNIQFSVMVNPDGKYSIEMPGGYTGPIFSSADSAISEAKKDIDGK